MRGFKSSNVENVEANASGLPDMKTTGSPRWLMLAFQRSSTPSISGISISPSIPGADRGVSLPGPALHRSPDVLVLPIPVSGRARAHASATRLVAAPALDQPALMDLRCAQRGRSQMRPGDGVPRRGAGPRHRPGLRWARARRARTTGARGRGSGSLKRSGCARQGRRASSAGWGAVGERAFTAV